MAIPLAYNVRNLLVRRWTSAFSAGGIALVVAATMLLAALALPSVKREPHHPSARMQWFVLAACLLLYLFSSANQYANLQWNTGVRYLVPLVPLLFFFSVPVFERMPRALFQLHRHVAGRGDTAEVLFEADGFQRDGHVIPPSNA